MQALSLGVPTEWQHSPSGARPMCTMPRCTVLLLGIRCCRCWKVCCGAPTFRATAMASSSFLIRPSLPGTVGTPAACIGAEGQIALPLEEKLDEKRFAAEPTPADRPALVQH